MGNVIKAIIFDFDGLILDTETPIFTAWKQVYERHGCTLTLDEYAGCLGSDHHSFNPYDDLEEKAKKSPDWEKIRPELVQTYRDLIDRNDALPGVRHLIGQAREQGLRLAVASSSTREWVTGHLSRLGLLHAFELFRTRDDVENLKPAPDLFEAACGGLGIGADEAFVLEDSPNGVLAAKRAGIFCIAVPNALTRNLPLNDPDLVVYSLDEAPLDYLLSQIALTSSPG